MEEIILLQQLKGGDEFAFRQIFDLYIRKVYRFVFGYLKNKAEAEDVTQLIFQKLWEKRATIDLQQSFNGFVFTIAYRATIDQFRANARNRQFAAGDFKEQDAPVSYLQADDLVNHQQLASFYQKALQELPERRREIFILSRHEGLSNKEIADRLQLSVKTVENQMTAALSTFREYFGGLEMVLIPLVIFF
jgi:RNA polymerase sigma-70 factor (ECF subfamily)